VGRIPNATSKSRKNFNVAERGSFEVFKGISSVTGYNMPALYVHEGFRVIDLQNC
jgi:hypothetical protein